MKKDKAKANPNTSPRYGGDNGRLLQLKLLNGGHCFIDATRVIVIVDLPAIEGIGDNIPRRTRIDMVDVPDPLIVAAGAQEVGALVDSYTKAAQATETDES